MFRYIKEIQKRYPKITPDSSQLKKEHVGGDGGKPQPSQFILNPSTDDLMVTQRLHEAGNILGIKVLDHLIFSDEGFRSMLEEDELIS